MHVYVTCRYDDMFIVPIEQLEETNPFPLELIDLEREVDRLCHASYERLRNE